MLSTTLTLLESSNAFGWWPHFATHCIMSVKVHAATQGKEWEAQGQCSHSPTSLKQPVTRPEICTVTRRETTDGSVPNAWRSIVLKDFGRYFTDNNTASAALQPPNTPVLTAGDKPHILTAVWNYYQRRKKNLHAAVVLAHAPVSLSTGDIWTYNSPEFVYLEGAHSSLNIKSQSCGDRVGGLTVAWLQRRHPVAVHLIEVDLSHAVLETTGACMRLDVSPLTGLSLKLPDTVYRRDYKYSLFFFFMISLTLLPSYQLITQMMLRYKRKGSVAKGENSSLRAC